MSLQADGEDRTVELTLGLAFIAGLVSFISPCVLPLAVKWESGLVMPGIYGIATGLPVLLFAVLLAVGAQKVTQTYNRVMAFERWARTITGVLFIVVGIYYCLTYIYGVSLF
mgnify:CR=1 FL=1